jgi:hypothetical protein
LHGSAVSRFLSTDHIGRLANFRPPKTPAGEGLQRLPIVSATVSATLIGLGVLGLLALVALIRRRREVRAWAVACCPAVGVVLVLVNPYGQEGAFRAAVFGIPWLAMLAAMGLPAVRRVWARLFLLEGTILCTATFLIASFGLDAGNVTRPTDVAAFRYAAAQAAQRPQDMCYLLQLGTGDLPGPVPTRATKFRILTGADLDGAAPPADPDAQVAAITTRLLAYTREPVGATQLYAIWSPVVAAYQYEYGVQLPGDFAALREAFRRSPYWTVGFHQGRTYVFRFVAENYDGTAP